MRLKRSPAPRTCIVHTAVHTCNTKHELLLSCHIFAIYLQKKYIEKVQYVMGRGRELGQFNKVKKSYKELTAGSHCLVHKFEGHKGKKVGHPLGLHIVFEVQVGGQGASIVEGAAT